jgi:D-glycerate 3-kinase
MNWLDQTLTTAKATILADNSRAKAFGITPQNIDVVIQERVELFKLVYPEFCEFCNNVLGVNPETMRSLRDVSRSLLWDLWLPLGLQLAQRRQNMNRPLIQGILGGQGTGKTTLAQALRLVLSKLGYQTLSLSLDDLYKTYSDRIQLQQQDSRLLWRGPPGTHDVNLGIEVLDQIRQSQNLVSVPRFDKSAHNGMGDRTTPDIVSNIDIVLFEGWFVGVRPIDPQAFDQPPSPINTYTDREFARDMNRQLHSYLPLWERLDHLIILYPQDYRYSLQWRKQAEHQMIAKGKSGMTDHQIEEFVDYFWRALHPELFIQPLLKLPEYVDLVIEINADHSFGAVYGK